MKLEYRGLAPRGTFVGGGRPKGRPYGAVELREGSGRKRRCSRPYRDAQGKGGGASRISRYFFTGS